MFGSLLHHSQALSWKDFRDARNDMVADCKDHFFPYFVVVASFPIAVCLKKSSLVSLVTFLGRFRVFGRCTLHRSSARICCHSSGIYRSVAVVFSHFEKAQDYIARMYDM